MSEISVRSIQAATLKNQIMIPDHLVSMSSINIWFCEKKGRPLTQCGGTAIAITEADGSNRSALVQKFEGRLGNRFCRCDDIRNVIGVFSEMIIAHRAIAILCNLFAG